MRHALGTLGLVAVLSASALSGCGSDPGPAGDAGGSRATDGTGGTGSPAPTGGPVDFTTVALVSSVNAGGRVSPRATVLDDARAVAAFSEQFRSDAMAVRLRQEVARADVPSGRTLVGAVVAIGCDVPPGVDVQRLGDGLAITPQEVPSPLPECLAPVTTVALVSVDARLV